MLKKNIILTTLSFLVFACSSGSKEAIVMGMGLPLTGKMAEYGQKAKKGAELALEEINASGGINGRPFAIDFQDDQADPKQALALASRFIADQKVVVVSEFGTSPVMVVAPLYQKAGLVLCGFSTHHPDLTKPGDCIWGTAPLLSKIGTFFASYIKDLKMEKPAIFFVNHDWGKTLSDYLVKTLVQSGVQVGLLEAYLTDEKDFRSLISKAKAKGVDGFALVSTLHDASLLVQQIRGQGLKGPICVADAVAVGDQFPQMAGRSAEGVYISGNFYPDDSRPEVADFIKKWKAKYLQEEPDYLATQAYDLTILVSYVLKLSDGTRASVKEALAQLKDVPSVINHKVNFNLSNRRIEEFLGARLVVKDGKVVPFKSNHKE